MSTSRPNPRAFLLLSASFVVAVLLAACGGGGGGGGGGTTPPVTAPATRGATQPTTTGRGPSGATLTLSTPAGNPLSFEQQQLTAGPNQQVTITYTNNSNVPHNVSVRSGQNASAPAIAATPIFAGPNQTRSITFTTPAQPGRYYFFCEVHPDQMNGFLVVQ